MSQDLAEEQRRSAGSALASILQETADALKGSAGSVFADPSCTVLTEDDGDILTRVAAALGSLGISAVVSLAKADAASQNLPGPCFREVALAVELDECAATNRSPSGLRVTALEAAEAAAAILHQLRLPSGCLLLVESIAKKPQPPPPADACFVVTLRTGEIKLRKRP